MKLARLYRRPLCLLLAPMLLAACSNKEEKAATVHMPALSLGTPGLTEASADISPVAVTHVLEKNEQIRFVDDQGKIEILHRRGRSFREGDMVVGNEKQPLLLKVKKVESKSSGSTVLLAKLGGMNDLLNPHKDSVIKLETTPKIEAKDLSAAPAADAAKPSRFEVDENGRVVMENMELFDLEFDDKAGLKFGMNKILGVPVIDPHDKLDISGVAAGRYRAVLNQAMVHVIPTFRSEYRWSGLRPQELRSRIDAQLKYRMDITFEAAGKAEITALMDLFKKKVIPVRVPGPVPVYVDVELSLPVGITLNATAKGSVRVVYEAEYAFTSDLRYTEAEGLKTTADQGAKVLQHDLTAAAEGELILSAELFLQPTVQARIYRVLGPNTYLQPYVRAELQIPSPAAKDDLFVGVGGGVGLQVSEPFLLNNLFSLDSGRVFDFSASWDIFSGSTPEPEKLPYLVNEGQTLTKLTNEGYVVLDFSSKALPPGTRFALSESPKGGYVVPSQRFFLDGKLFYYPRAEASEDTLSITLLLPDGTRDRREIKLSLSKEVQAEAAKERFAQSSNSVAAAYGHPQEFQSKVPHHGFVFGGIRAEPIDSRLEQEMRALLDRHRHLLTGKAPLSFLQRMRDMITYSGYIHFDPELAEELHLKPRADMEFVSYPCRFSLSRMRGSREGYLRIVHGDETGTCEALALSEGAKTGFWRYYRENEEGREQLARYLIPHIAKVKPDGSLEEIPLERIQSDYGSSLAFPATEEAQEYLLYFTPSEGWEKGFIFAPSVRLSIRSKRSTYSTNGN